MLKKKGLPIPNNYVALLLLIFAYSSVAAVRLGDAAGLFALNPVVGKLC